MAGWQLVMVALCAVLFVIVALVSGDPAFLIPMAILGVLIVAYAFAHRAIARVTLQRHGGRWRAAMSDERDPIPSSPDVPNDVRPAGDTPEAHDEISPRDLPPGHPGRRSAEQMAEREGGTTRGNVGGGAADDDLGVVDEEPRGARRRG